MEQCAAVTRLFCEGTIEWIKEVDVPPGLKSEANEVPQTCVLVNLRENEPTLT